MRLIYKRGAERIAFPLDEGETFIGRKDYCDIYFPDGSLSKRHCRLVRRGTRLKVFDAGSRNGTLVNNEEIDEVELRNGDVIQCGKLRFRVEGIPDGSAPGDDEFELIDSEPGSRGSRGQRRSRARSSHESRSRSQSRSQSRSHGRSRSRTQPSGARASVPLVTAKAVASTAARPSMLDVLPELPPSIEAQGVGDSQFKDEGFVEERPRAEAWFRLVEGGEEQVWELYGETVTIGSKRENAICISGEGVSRYHAEVTQEEGTWLLKDLGARNGIFVAGDRIDIYELKTGDEVQIGTCKLRFELQQAGAGAAFQEVLEALKSDPVGAFKQDSRVRMAAMALVAALALIVIAIPKGGGGYIGQDGDQVASVGDWLATGSEHLVAGRYREARDVFRKAKATVPAQHQKIPRVLEKVANQWMTLERGALTFRWTKGQEQLEEAVRLDGLPSNLNGWLKDQVALVELNGKAYQLLTEAEGLGTQANEQAAAKQIDAALETYRNAISRFRDVPPTSLLSERALELATSFQQDAFQALVEECRRRINGQTPKWDDVLALIGKGYEYAETPEQTQELRRLSAECEDNRQDEGRFMQAVQIVRDRLVQKYPDAVALLKEIRTTSRIYQDSKAYVDWIDADLKVRQAKKAYDLGDAQRAFQLLNDAMQHEVLGPEARASVREKRQGWARVVRAYERGTELLQAGDHQAAKGEFEKVIQREPNSKNRYHLRAKAQLKFIAGAEAYSFQKKLDSGFSALRRGDWEDAITWFSQVKKDPKHNRRDLEAIQAKVSEANQRKRLLVNAERDFRTDRQERFVELRDIFKLLAQWLPRSQGEDRAKARKLLKAVIDRLDNWKAGSGN